MVRTVNNPDSELAWGEPYRRRAKILAVIWVGVVYATIPLVRTFQRWFLARWDKGWVTVFVLVAMAIMVLAVIRVVRRLSIRPHGFVSLHADWTTGQVTTRPIVFAGNELFLNCSTSAAGFIQVELQDASGAPIEGYSLQDADLIFGDHLDASVSWGGRTDLAALTGRPVRMRFVLCDADIYALRTAKGPGDR